MDTQLLYYKDYYSLKRLAEENSFIENLDQKDITGLIYPSIQKISDKLFSYITTAEKPSTNFRDVIENETEINKKLEETLIHNKFYTAIKEKEITSSFFTNAIKRLYNKLFIKDGHNDEKYFTESCLLYWLEDYLAKTITKDERYKSYDTILKVLDQTEMLHHFYISLVKNIPLSWINARSNDWTEIKNPRNILDYIRTFDKDYFESIDKQIPRQDGETIYNYISGATKLSGHAMFNDEHSFRSMVLFEKNISLWVKFWDNLKWPILQDIPFHYIKNPHDLLKLSKELVAQKDYLVSDPKYLGIILLINLFDSNIKVTENLDFYADEDRINGLTLYERNDEIIKEGKELIAKWDEEKIKIYREIIQNLTQILSVEEVSDWVFSYQPRPSSTRYNNNYNTEIKTLVDIITPYLESDPLDVQIEKLSKDFNLQKFGLILSQINEHTEKGLLEDLLNAITQYVRSDKFYWDNTFSSAYWPALRGIGHLISLSDYPVEKAKKSIQKFQVQYEGWILRKKLDNNDIQKESFILCGVILLLEHENAFKTKQELTVYFYYVLQYVITQTRFSNRYIQHDYVLPIYLLYLIVNQIFTDLKKDFEEKVINEIDNLQTIIEVLSNDTYTLLPGSVALLKNRIDNEFHLEKRKYIQRKQKWELEKLENSIQRLGIE